jgi:hypothetical protein
MKKLTLFLLIATLLTACGPAPQSVVDSWAEAMNAGDMDKALSYLAEDAVVTIVPAMEGDGVYNGHAEIRGWYEPLLSSKGVTILSECSLDGETLTCLDTYADEGLKSMGVDFLEGEFVAVVREGKIQSYMLTITPESLAKFPPPPEPTPEPEVRMTSAEAIAGLWLAKYGNYKVWHEFKPDSTVTVEVSEFGVISSGPYWFENDLMKFDDENGNCVGLVGKYEVYGTYQGEKLIQLRFVLVGDDPCTDRKGTLAGNTMVPAE